MADDNELIKICHYTKNRIIFVTLRLCSLMGKIQPCIREDSVTTDDFNSKKPRQEALVGVLMQPNLNLGCVVGKRYSGGVRTLTCVKNMQSLLHFSETAGMTHSGCCRDFCFNARGEGLLL